MSDIEYLLNKAFSLGQLYWQQADSEYVTHNKKADATFAKFAEIVSNGAEIQAELERLRTESEELKQERDRLLHVLSTAQELLEVAELRGDNVLPAPPDDPLLWTARMQDAWNDLEEAVSQVEEA